jgi:hypothetical protein
VAIGNQGGTLGLPAGLPSDSITDLTEYLNVGEPGLSGGTGNLDGGDRALTRWINKEVTRAEPHVLAWREQANDCYRFRDGHQLSSVDEQLLRAQKRPNTAFNEIQKFLKFVSGIERRTQQALLFLPRNADDQMAQMRGEWKTKLYEWFMSQCFVGDTLVRAGDVRRGMGRHYDGPVVYLEFANGKNLTGTPNHPILTTTGWKSLANIHEGDQLIDASLLDSAGLASYFDHVESRIEEKARPLKSRPTAAVSVTRPDDFHGDGAYSNVHVIWTNGSLRDGGVAHVLKDFVQAALKHTTAISSLLFSTGQPYFPSLTVAVNDSHSIAREFTADSLSHDAQSFGHFDYRQPFVEKFLKSVGRDFLHPFSRLPNIFTTSHSESSLYEPFGNRGGIQSEAAGDNHARQLLREIESGDFVSRYRNAVLPTIRVTKATLQHYVGSVFNLDTSEGFYTANGIIAHNCNGQYARSKAFEDKLVGGLGFVDIGITRVTNPHGNPMYSRIPPKEMLFPECQTENLEGIRWLGREKNMDVQEACRKWPDYAIYLRSAAGGAANEDQFPDYGRGAGRPIQYVVPWIMTEPLNKNGGGSTGKPGKVSILEFQYYEDEPGFYFFDPLEKEDAWLNEKDYRKYKLRLAQLYDAQITDFAPTEKRVYKKTFLLNRRIMLEDPKPLATNGENPSFTWNVMTGVWDDEDKCWYGFVRVLMDPQRYANAMSRQILELMGAATKGGYLAETGAITVAQKRDIEETGSRPGSINMVQPDAIRTGRIKDKAIPQVPAGTLAVWQAAIDQIEKVGGISTQMMGALQGAVPGVSLRRQMLAGMMLLAPDFDSLSLFRQKEGYIVADFLKLIADDRLVRIGGAFDAQSIQLKRDIFDEYDDIILDENDQDPNLRQLYTDSILQIAPMLIRTGNFFPELLDYLNLPVQIRQRLKQGMQQAEQQKAEMTQQGLSVGGRGKPRSLEEIQAQVQLTKARTAEHIGKAQMYGSQAKHLGAQTQATTKGIRRDDMKTIMDLLLETHRINKEENARKAEYLLKAVDSIGGLTGTIGGIVAQGQKNRNGSSE